MFIYIEGNIGAGKTSLSTQMAGEFNAKLILERFKDNPFLPKFYKDQQRYAFPLEMSFLADRYQQLVEDIAQFDLTLKERVFVNNEIIYNGDNEARVILGDGKTTNVLRVDSIVGFNTSAALFIPAGFNFLRGCVSIEKALGSSVDLPIREFSKIE